MTNISAPSRRRQMPARVEHPDAKPTGLPAEPCFMCGARGWCEHRKEPTA